MATSIGPTYDPASTAAALAEKHMGPRQQILTARTNQASAISKALTTLNSAIVSYQSSLASLTALNKTMLSQSATFSDTTIGSATAGATAAAGSYAFFVERLATAHQVSYAAVPDSLADGGTLAITAGPAVADKFDVDLAAADADGDGTLTVRELAAAINRAPNNASLVSASVVTVDGVAQLVLTSKNTGVNYGVVVDATNVTNAGLKSALTPAGGPATLVAAQDAVVWLGAKDTGTKIQQATNTFTNVEGVKMTFTRAQAAGENPVTLTVAADTSGTTANVQAFIDAYNKLKGVIDGMVASGDPSKGVAGGPFAHDSGVKALQGRLVSMLRQAGATSLAAFGITATRQGALTLDATRLTKQLATDPTGLDQLIGSSSASASSGIAGSLDSYLKLWSGTTNGQIKQRKDATDKLQIDLTKRQGLLDGQYDRSYQRFLIQFTKLQSLQSQMSSNNSLFDALFGDKSK